MLRTIIWFFCFGVYLIGTLANYVKLNSIRKNKSEGDADTYAHKIAKKWADFCIRTIGAEIEMVGVEHLPEGNCLFVGNHQGYLDIPLIYSKIDKKIGFIAKKELEKAPILSTWMKALHCIFMDRDNPREAIKSINEGINYLDKGFSLVIFPEGTRSKSMRLGEFKKGSMKLGLKSKVPIVPITIIGSYKVFEESNRIKPAKVKLIISKPIFIDKLSKEEQSNLSEIIRESINENLEKQK
jgi:1-acyl-sn-glycerol-3-phosphate acyltransferase